MERWKDRKFVLLLYPDEIAHVQAMDLLKTGGYKFAAILHDKDTYTEDDETHKAGDLKKPHWHVVVKFLNPIWSTSLASQLGIQDNYIKKCTNIDGALLYLVHANASDKFQYDLDDVFGDLKIGLAKLLVDDDEGARVLTIVGMIDDSPGHCSYREILVKACHAGLYGEFRRLGAGVKYLIDEHNEEHYTEERRLMCDEIERRRHLEGFQQSIENGRDLNFVERIERAKKSGHIYPEAEW